MTLDCLLLSRRLNRIMRKVIKYINKLVYYIRNFVYPRFIHSNVNVEYEYR